MYDDDNSDKLVKRRVKMKLLAALSVLLLSACSTTANFTSGSDDYIIKLKLADTIEQSTELCKTPDTPSNAVICGCHRKIGNVHYIVSIKRWDIVGHELNHAFGKRHSERDASCTSSVIMYGGF